MGVPIRPIRPIRIFSVLQLFPISAFDSALSALQLPKPAIYAMSYPACRSSNTAGRPLVFLLSADPLASVVLR